MTIWQAILLGLVQGLTEFIPISSTAHLTLTGKLLGLIQPENPAEWTAFIAVIQLGTLFAVIVYFWSDIFKITHGFIVTNLAALKKQSVDEEVRLQAKLGWLVMIGSLPIAIIGLALKKVIEGALTKNLWVISFGLIAVALLLALAEVISSQQRNMSRLKFSDALSVGIAQVFALIPGFSRSGTTITAGLFVGLDRPTAARFSFLLSIPAIAASGILELIEVLRAHHVDWQSVAVATIAAAISGYFSIEFLLRFLQKYSSFLFVSYRVVLGLILIGLLLSGRITAN